MMVRLILTADNIVPQMCDLWLNVVTDSVFVNNFFYMLLWSYVKLSCCLDCSWLWLVLSSFLLMSWLQSLFALIEENTLLCKSLKPQIISLYFVSKDLCVNMCKNKQTNRQRKPNTVFWNNLQNELKLSQLVKMESLSPFDRSEKIAILLSVRFFNIFVIFWFYIWDTCLCLIVCNADKLYLLLLPSWSDLLL